MRPDALTPNQAAKRREVIEAARSVLANRGLAGCTVRAIADASPLTKSAIHYYFADIDELVDEAMQAHVDAFLASLQEVADAHAGPAVPRLWAVLEAYLRAFDERPEAAFLWFEYWAAVARRGDTGAIDRMLRRVAAFLTQALREAGVQDAAARTSPLLSYLLGATARQRVDHRPFASLGPEIAVICGLQPDGRAGQATESPPSTKMS
jgi:AcrR family transcriptional regulator